MSRKSSRSLKPVKRYGHEEEEEHTPAYTPKSKADWLETAKRLRAKKQTTPTEPNFSDNDADGEEIEPCDSASQISCKSAVTSESESAVQRRIELQRKQARLLQELKEQEDQQEIELQEFKLAQLKLQKAKRAELYSIEMEVNCNKSNISKSSKIKVVSSLPDCANKITNINPCLSSDEAKRQAFKEKIFQAAQQPHATVTVSEQLLNPYASPFVNMGGVSHSVFDNLSWSVFTSPQMSNILHPSHMTMASGKAYNVPSATSNVQSSSITLSSGHLMANDSSIYQPFASVKSIATATSHSVDSAFNQPLGLHMAQASSSGNVCLSSNEEKRSTEGEDLLKAMVLQQHELIDSIRLPQTAAVTFDGDCLKYYAFIKSFDNLIAKSHLDDAAKLNRLCQCCIKDAKRVVETCLLIENPTVGFQRARNLLADRYGNPYKISQSWISKIMDFKPIKAGENSKIQEYADELTMCYDTLVGLNQINEISQQNTLLHIVQKLPYFLQGRFRSKVATWQVNRGNPTILDVVEFVREAAREANHAVYGVLAPGYSKEYTPASSVRSHATITENKSKGKGYQKSTKPTDLTSEFVDNRYVPHGGRNEKVLPPCVMCNAPDHGIFKCTKWKDLRVDDRWTVVKEKKLCYSCLKPNHTSQNCKNAVVCGIDNCTKLHARFLHRRDIAKPKSETSTSSPMANEETQVKSVQSAHIGAGVSDEKVVLPIVAVIVTNPESGASIQTYALLDGGADSTFCTNQLADKLRASGPSRLLTLHTMEKTTTKPTTYVSLHVAPADNPDASIKLRNVYVRQTLPMDLSNRATQQEIKQLNHLKHLNIPWAESDMVELLIGNNNPAALAPLDSVHGTEEQAYGFKTRLGWAIGGPVNANCYNLTTAKVNFIKSEYEGLSKQLEKFWLIDSPPDDNNIAPWSQEDQKVMSLWETTTKFESDHYEVKIPLKPNSDQLRSNENLARQRLGYLQTKLLRDKSLHQQYTNYVKDMLNQGYCEVTPTSEENKIAWFLPHHPVLSDSKPGKIRIVYDCSSKYMGLSLNDVCYQGPDLTSRLIGVLLRFRLHAVALMADIQSMFYQVRVPTTQRNLLQFLWWPDGNLSTEPISYQMTVHPFGGVWSPSACSYALQKAARDRSTIYSLDVVVAVSSDFYVDDFVKSIPTVEQASALVTELKSLLASAGFNLTKWLSNMPSVLSSLPKTDLCESVKDTKLCNYSVDRALGIHWSIVTDELRLNTAVKQQQSTRKGMLSVVSSVFDPLGFVGPFIVTAKLLLQELSRRKLTWEHTIPDDIRTLWEEWLLDLQLLATFSIPRCITSGLQSSINKQCLHVFCDASTKAYGAVCYLQSTNDKGQSVTNLLMSKGRLAPLHTMTIPRLELSAAVVAAKLTEYVKTELKIPLESIYLWSDSTTVLYYLSNESRRYQMFVANRVTTIKALTNTNQWHYIPTKLNPADCLSRGVTARELIANRLWLHGPEFLNQSSEYWPKVPNLHQEVDADQLELKKTETVCAATSAAILPQDDVMDRLLRRYSTFFALKKTVAYLILFKQFLLAKSKRQPLPTMKPRLTVQQLRQAEESLIRFVQHQHYDFNVDNKSTKPSAISKLEPIIVNDLLRVGGRTKLHQIILPGTSHIARLIVSDYHNNCAHMGTEYVLSILRERYWIVSSRRLIKSVRYHCATCRLKFSTPMQQRMADLPSTRITSGQPPFSTVGIDYFGPILVKIGRSQVKRYGCLFSCLVTRAVHIEMADSLETSAFLNAFQRFLSRRPKPSHIISDNGSNFIGAKQEIRKCLNEWNQSTINNYMLQREIEWTMNPPAASHFGGAYERMIRSTRKILLAVTNEQRLTDDGLSTLFCIAEGVLNSRPLTIVPDDSSDINPLTPNLLLRPGTSNDLPLGKFIDRDQFSRRWRQLQFLGDRFWHRWRKEYYPTLQLRSKWFRPQNNINVGDVVLIVDHNLPRNQWLLGIVTEVFPAKDQLVRSAKIRTKLGIFHRPIVKLCLVEGVDK
jgi:hypothetical protein